MRHTISKKYMSRNLLEQAQNILGGQRKVSWMNIAEYADYLKQYSYEIESEFYSKDGLKRY